MVGVTTNSATNDYLYSSLYIYENVEGDVGDLLSLITVEQLLPLSNLSWYVGLPN